MGYNQNAAHPAALLLVVPDPALEGRFLCRLHHVKGKISTMKQQHVLSNTVTSMIQSYNTR